MGCPFLCLSFHQSAAFHSLAVSGTMWAPHVVSFSCQFLSGAAVVLPSTKLGQTAFASASIHWLRVMHGQQCTLCHHLYVSCACFMRCGTDGAELPFGVMQIPTYIRVCDHATFATPACSHGSRGLCVGLQFVFARPISGPISLNPSLRSTSICSIAFCDVANSSMSSAHVPRLDTYSSNRKPNYVPFFHHFLFSAASTVSTSMGLSGASCGSPLVVLNLLHS